MSILIGAAVALIAVVFLILKMRRDGGQEGYGSNRIGDGLKRFEANKRRYAVMGRALLDETDDEMLVEAVLSGLWARMADDLSDAPQVLAGETRGRRYIFALYAVTGGVGQDGFGGLIKGPDAAFVPDCMLALDAIGAASTAQVLREAAAAGADAQTYTEPYLESFEAEDGRGRMVRYIRDNAGDFIDPS